MFWSSITNIHFFFSSQNAKDQKIRNCATAPGDFLNHTHFASCYSLQQQNITKATERILAAENYDNSKYRISFVCRSEIDAMSLKGILKKHPVFGASPKLVGALSKLISILFRCASISWFEVVSKSVSESYFFRSSNSETVSHWFFGISSKSS